MLVLSRKQGERIVINDGEIILTFLGFSAGGTVRIGIDAPPEIQVRRAEQEKRYCDGCHRQVEADWFREVEKDGKKQVLCHRHFQ